MDKGLPDEGLVTSPLGSWFRLTVEARIIATRWEYAMQRDSGFPASPVRRRGSERDRVALTQALLAHDVGDGLAGETECLRFRQLPHQSVRACVRTSRLAPSL